MVAKKPKEVSCDLLSFYYLCRTRNNLMEKKEMLKRL